MDRPRSHDAAVTEREPRGAGPVALDPAATLRAWQAELDNAHIYAAMAEAEASPQVAEVYRHLAETERGHAAALAAALGRDPGPHRSSWRARTLALTARRLGPGAVLPTMLQGEKADQLAYSRQAQIGGAALAGDEAGHARILEAIAGARVGGMSGADLARLEGRHRGTAGNALRAAVLGANDGLVSNLSLVMGVAGAAVDDQALLLTGLAGLLAGAISMALGEWLSVQSSRELYARQIGIEAAELAAAPEEEARELALIYQAKGVPADQAREMADRIVANPDRALDTLVREELAVDPAELGGSAWEAAITSFLLFALGAIIPVLPFFFTGGARAVATSLALSALGLFAIGAGISLFTGRGARFSGLRQMLFGLAAAAVTYGVGWLMGVSLAG